MSCRVTKDKKTRESEMNKLERRKTNKQTKENMRARDKPHPERKTHIHRHMHRFIPYAYTRNERKKERK